jgi:hypothetical protein
VGIGVCPTMSLRVGLVGGLGLGHGGITDDKKSK